MRDGREDDALLDVADDGRIALRMASLAEGLVDSRDRAAVREEQKLAADAEERRIMYVALTRARNHLAVTYPLQVYATRRGADYSIDQLSRFLDRGVREHMQRVALTQDAEAGPAVQPGAGTQPVLDLRALLRGRFSGVAGGPMDSPSKKQ